jgi:hypothetical protein
MDAISSKHDELPFHQQPAYAPFLNEAIKVDYGEGIGGGSSADVSSNVWFFFYTAIQMTLAFQSL